MGSQQDFRSLQAKFQASLPETSDLPRKPPKPELNKLKKPPQPEHSAVPRKPPQPEFADLPPRPPKPEFGALAHRFPQLEATLSPRAPPLAEAWQPAPSALVHQPRKPELSSTPQPPADSKASVPPRRSQQPEPSEATLKPAQLERSASPGKPPQPEFCAPRKKPSQSQVGGLPGKSLPQPQSSEVPKAPPGVPEPSEPQPHALRPVASAHPKKPLLPEFNLGGPPQAQASGHPRTALPQPEFSKAPQMPPWKCELSEPHPHPSQPSLSAFPRKPPQLQLSDPKKHPQPEAGDLTRTCSKPEVSSFPKKLQQPEFKAPQKQSPQSKPGGLPRTSSEPEFCVHPRKSPQPRQHPQAAFFTDLPRKPPLPGSASESSLPTATAGPRARLPLSLGLGAGRQRAGALACRSGWTRGLTPGHAPRRRPLPPASSLGPPPAKPPPPPGPVDLQSLRSPAASALRRTRSSAGVLFQVRQPEDAPGDLEEVYEVYDDVEPTEDSRHSPKGRDEGSPAWQPPRKSPSVDLRKEKAPQQQQLTSADQKTLKQIRKAEKAEREFRKKFKFEGEIVIQTKMMIDPNAKTRRGGGKHLGIRRGEILEVIEFTSDQEMLCRDAKGKYGYVPRTALLPLETEVYDDVGSWGM
ncbi:PREDICTED: PML-RARA-regulated adapter molecule 1 isoform X2 [Condylura cristata]|uniref:PML-RARA-regulated adapter molecule 1 isoform X2 n=1 Tax=Condylura cristata TaxID=143302 RepID=UPI0006439C95|nr:PREDICTED: PML-RARA-regulated adapter molecule 1 isoform X2 [Condylura cristata]